MVELRWDDPSLNAGTMVRGALWLATVVGEGNTFTKNEVRGAFPNVSQADRRIRDLRKYGWVILASTEDATLSHEEQRLVEIGLEVWDPSERRKVSENSITAKQRRAILAADDYQCVVCGIAAGEVYADASNLAAVLSISRREVQLKDEVAVQLVTECSRCRAGAPPADVSAVTALVSEISQLDAADLARLARWADRNRRLPDRLDRIWTTYRRLPAESRAFVREQL